MLSSFVRSAVRFVASLVAKAQAKVTPPLKTMDDVVVHRAPPAPDSEPQPETVRLGVAVMTTPQQEPEAVPMPAAVLPITKVSKFTPAGVTVLVSWAESPVECANRIRRLIEARKDRYTAAELIELEAAITEASRPKPLTPAELVAALERGNGTQQPSDEKVTSARVRQPRLPAPAREPVPREGMPSHNEIVAFSKGAFSVGVSRLMTLKAYQDSPVYLGASSMGELNLELSKLERAQKHAERIARDAQLKADLTACATRKLAAKPVEAPKNKGRGKARNNAKKAA